MGRPKITPAKAPAPRPAPAPAKPPAQAIRALVADKPKAVAPAVTSRPGVGLTPSRPVAATPSAPKKSGASTALNMVGSLLGVTDAISAANKAKSGDYKGAAKDAGWALASGLSTALMFVPGIGTAAGAALKGGITAAKVGTAVKAGQAVTTGTRAAATAGKTGSAIKYKSVIPQPQTVGTGARQLTLTGPKGTTSFAPRPMTPTGPRPITPSGPKPIGRPAGPKPGSTKPTQPKPIQTRPITKSPKPGKPSKPSTKPKKQSRPIKDKLKKAGKVAAITIPPLILLSGDDDKGPDEPYSRPPEDPIWKPKPPERSGRDNGPGGGGSSDDPTDDEVLEETITAFTGNTVDASNKAVVSAFVERIGKSLEDDYRNVIESTVLNSVDTISPISTLVDPESINSLENTIASQRTDDDYGSIYTPILSPAEFAAIATFGTQTGTGFTANAVKTDSSGLPIIDLLLKLPSGKNIAGYEVQYIQGEIT